MNKTPRELALLAARALSEKKGREIQVLEIGDLTTLADYFVIATGSSNTQINALVDNVEKVLREEAQEEPLHREGYRAGTWVLLDYGCIAIHVFNAEAREFYGLERLWRAGKPLDLTGVVECRPGSWLSTNCKSASGPRRCCGARPSPLNRERSTV